MNIEIEVKKDLVIVILKEKEKSILEDSFNLDNNLGEILLKRIDRVITEAKINFNEIKNFKMRKELDDSYTSVRIVETIVKALNWSLKRL